MKNFKNKILLGVLALSCAQTSFFVNAVPDFGDLEDAVNAGVNFAGVVPGMIDDIKAFTVHAQELKSLSSAFRLYGTKVLAARKAKTTYVFDAADFEIYPSFNPKTIRKDLVVAFLTVLTSFIALVNDRVIGTFPNREKGERNTNPNSLLTLPLTEAEIFGLGWSDVNNVMDQTDKITNILEKINNILKVVTEHVK